MKTFKTKALDPISEPECKCCLGFQHPLSMHLDALSLVVLRDGDRGKPAKLSAAVPRFSLWDGARETTEDSYSSSHATAQDQQLRSLLDFPFHVKAQASPFRKGTQNHEWVGKCLQPAPSHRSFHNLTPKKNT